MTIIAEDHDNEASKEHGEAVHKRALENEDDARDSGEQGLKIIGYIATAGIIALLGAVALALWWWLA